MRQKAMQQQGNCSLVVESMGGKGGGVGFSLVGGARHTVLCDTAAELKHDSWWSRAWQMKAVRHHS